MSYAAPSDVENRFPVSDLVQLTNQDPNSSTINTGYLQTFLDDASSEIDSYLESRFTLPLADPPVRLLQLCIDVAIYNLQQLRPLHDIEQARKKYEDAVKFLTKVNKGEITLGLSVDSKEPPAAQETVLTQSKGLGTIFDRGKLKVM